MRGLEFELDQLLNPPAVFSHLRDVLRDPDLSLKEKRAILSSWASDACAVESAPQLRHPPGLAAPVPFNDIVDALRSLDDSKNQPQPGGASMRLRGPRRRNAPAPKQPRARQQALLDTKCSMTAMSAALLQAYQANLRRYCELLSTDLTNDERRALHRRIAEAQRAIERLEANDDLDLSREATLPVGAGGLMAAGMESRARL